MDSACIVKNWGIYLGIMINIWFDIYASVYVYFESDIIKCDIEFHLWYVQFTQ